MVWDLSKPARYDVVEWVLGGWGSPSSPEIHEHKGSKHFLKYTPLPLISAPKGLSPWGEEAGWLSWPRKQLGSEDPGRAAWPFASWAEWSHRGSYVYFNQHSPGLSCQSAKCFRWQHKVTLAEWSFWEACQQTSLYDFVQLWFLSLFEYGTLSEYV